MRELFVEKLYRDSDQLHYRYSYYKKESDTRFLVGHILHGRFENYRADDSIIARGCYKDGAEVGFWLEGYNFSAWID